MDVLQLYDCNETLKDKQPLVEAAEIKEEKDGEGNITKPKVPAVTAAQAKEWKKTDSKALIHIRTRVDEEIVPFIAECDTAFKV